jgi:hypothetical protein
MKAVNREIILLRTINYKALNLHTWPKVDIHAANKGLQTKMGQAKARRTYLKSSNNSCIPIACFVCWNTTPF